MQRLPRVDHSTHRTRCAECPRFEAEIPAPPLKSSWGRLTQPQPPRHHPRATRASEALAAPLIITHVVATLDNPHDRLGARC